MRRRRDELDTLDLYHATSGGEAALLGSGGTDADPRPRRIGVASNAAD